MTSSLRCHLPRLVLAALLGLAACARARPYPAEPGVTFQAHMVHDGLMIDAMRGGAPALAAPPSLFNFGGRPALAVATPDGEEGVWLVSPAETVVRRGDASTSPVVGRVEPDWTDNAVHFRIVPAHGPGWVTGRFHREDLGAGTSVLSRNAALSIDVEGTYRAEVRDLDGTPVGWLRVRIGVHAPSLVMYDGVLPPSIDEGLATATAAALGDEIARIQDDTVGTRRAGWRR